MSSAPRGAAAQAEPLCREALEGYRKTLGDEHPHTLATINNLAFLLQNQGHFDEAEQLYREGLECRRRTLGDEHQETLKAERHLVTLLAEKSDSGPKEDSATIPEERPNLKPVSHSTEKDPGGSDQ